MYLNYRDLDADTIIIGAGISGLCAALHLLETDPHFDLLILDVDEKWDSLPLRKDSSSINTRSLNNTQKSKKGRKLVTFDDEFTYSIGSQFFCSMQKDALRLLENFDIPLTKNINNNEKILVDYYKIYEVRGRDEIFSFLSIQDKIALKLCCNKIDKLCKNVSFKDPTQNQEMLLYDTMNMEVFLNKLADNKVVRDIITQTFLLNCGLQPRDVSALFFLAYCNSTQGILNQFHRNIEGLYQFRIDGGAETLRSKIIDRIGAETIVKVSAVTQISWDESFIGIKTPGGYFFANRAIYTLSEGETNNIKFVPHLSNSRKVISNNSVRGGLKKFGVIYEQPFWVKNNLSGDVYVMDTESKNGPVQICLNISEVGAGKYILIGLANKESQRNDILQQLAIYFGLEATKPKQYAEIDSSLLDLNFPLGFVSLKYFESINSPFGRIVWASPQTAIDWYGCLSGSIKVGFEGAIRLLGDIRPQTISSTDFEVLQPNFVNIPPRTVGLHGFHCMIPTVLMLIIVIIKLKKYFRKN